MLDGVLVDGVLVDGVLVDGVLVDGVLVDGVLVDGVLFDGVLFEGVLFEGVLFDGCDAPVVLLGDEVPAVVEPGVLVTGCEPLGVAVADPPPAPWLLTRRVPCEVVPEDAVVSTGAVPLEGRVESTGELLVDVSGRLVVGVVTAVVLVGSNSASGPDAIGFVASATVTPGFSQIERAVASPVSGNRASRNARAEPDDTTTAPISATVPAVRRDRFDQRATPTGAAAVAGFAE